MSIESTTGTLDDELRNLRDASAARTSPEFLAAREKLTDELERTVVANALAVGEIAPDFALRTATDDREVRLSTEFAKGPVVLCFYRGQWCPYCNLELRAVQRHKGEIEALGAQVFFVGPETRDNSMKMVEKTAAVVPVLYDIDGEAMDGFRLSFEQPESLRRAGAEAWNPRTGWRLPIPATYVIGRDGRVGARFVNADYRYRMEPAEIVEAVRKLA